MLRFIHHLDSVPRKALQVESAFITTSIIRRMTMRKLHHVAAACAISAIVLSGNVLAQATATPSGAAATQKEPTGKDIAFNRTKGNCLACHGMPTVPDA
jgi:mono/diheme cytochrome c family protein